MSTSLRDHRLTRLLTARRHHDEVRLLSTVGVEERRSLLTRLLSISSSIDVSTGAYWENGGPACARHWLYRRGDLGEWALQYTASQYEVVPAIFVNPSIADHEFTIAQAPASTCAGKILVAVKSPGEGKFSLQIHRVTLPLRSLGDAQVAAEYVAYNVGYLAGKSSRNKIAIIGHSQGAGLVRPVPFNDPIERLIHIPSV